MSHTHSVADLGCILDIFVDLRTCAGDREAHKDEQHAIWFFPADFLH